ncbi:hypothetical protein UCRNP2_9808 [Neofusicoccum parvum UCRNP2]|uniref:Uncharacterized protein n=1 Tax=Botryosphaeria parva (strain UCR-NP2) TaxID=1287680 RepID=R1GC98_BOTPV|nr:hypothetical protein UCRNP2_9808 [Neofusicoccum parvum UCRNP2]
MVFSKVYELLPKACLCMKGPRRFYGSHAWTMVYLWDEEVTGLDESLGPDDESDIRLFHSANEAAKLIANGSRSNRLETRLSHPAPLVEFDRKIFDQAKLDPAIYP